MTILNPAPALELSDELLSLVDICVPNEVEAATLTQLGVDDARGRPRGCGGAARARLHVGRRDTRGQRRPLRGP